MSEDWTRASAEAMTARLVRWCAIPSHAADALGQRAMADELVRAFGDLGAPPERVPVGPDGLQVLRVRSPERPGPRVLLVGHYDTVAHDGPHDAPEVFVEGDRILARGAADMKGGLLVMLTALELVEGAPEIAAPAWEVLLVPDEELGSPWSREMSIASARDAATALVFEAALPDGRLVRARKGVGTLTLDIRGRSSHAGRDPEAGRSAISALAEIIGQIEALADAAAGTTATVTAVRGGTAANVIPATAGAEVDVRVADASEEARVLSGIARACDEIGASRGVEITLHGGVHRPAKPVDAATEALFRGYQEGAGRIGVEIGWTDVGGGSDANLLAEVVPVLDGLGVVGGGLHAPDEYAVRSSLPQRAALAALLIARLATLSTRRTRRRPVSGA